MLPEAGKYAKCEDESAFCLTFDDEITNRNKYKNLLREKHIQTPTLSCGDKRSHDKVGGNYMKGTRVEGAIRAAKRHRHPPR